MSKRSKTRPKTRSKSAPKPAETKPSNGAPFKFTGTADELLAAADKIRADRPHPLAASEVLFDNGSVREDLTLLRLVRGMFEAPNRSRTGNTTVDFLSDVLLSGADDAELMQAAANEGTLDLSPVIDRAALRASWRAIFAVEIARRVEKGEVAR
jgi:hypothetical protein